MKIISIGKGDGNIFDEVMHQPAFVKFYHPQCGHCIDMAPAWKKMTRQAKSQCSGNVSIIEVHADAIPNIRSSIGKDIQGFPTIVAVNEGKISKSYEGDRSTEDLLRWFKHEFKKHGVKSKSKSKKRKRRTQRRKKRGAKRSKRYTKRK